MRRYALLLSTLLIVAILLASWAGLGLAGIVSGSYPH